MTIPVRQTDAAGQAAPMLAISATFTAEPMQEVLEFWGRELGWNYEIAFAPYNQVFQQLLDPSSRLAENRNGVNIVLVRPEDWGSDTLEENVRRFVSCLRKAAGRFSSPLLVCLCPASVETARQAEELLLSGARGLSTVHVVRQCELNNLYPVAGQRLDPHGDELARVPYTPAFFTALGTLLARNIQAMRSSPYKVIVLDCDETLWRGVCGEDGPEGVAVDASRMALQRFMVGQHDAGMLLCLASKNNEEDVLETFRAHPEMPLRLEHFAARRINWEAKSVNLAELAAELGLGLDSFVFVDDNAEECAEVLADRPEVLVLPLPAEADDIPRFLKHVWAFDRLNVTEEDRKRTALYSHAAERARLEKQASSLEEFIASLRLEVRIEPMAPEQLPRVAQLTRRTNQMNCTTLRRSESEIHALIQTGRAECLVVSVSDRFGDYGLTGVVIFTGGPEAILVDTFLLSCRVLGRGVEHRMLAKLGEIAGQRGIGRIDVPFVATARNRPALSFLESVGRAAEQPEPDGVVFHLPSGYARNLRYRPSVEAPAAAPAIRQAAVSARAEPIDFVRIATELNDAGKILERIHAGKQPAAAPASPAEPRTPLEERLAEIWADLLNAPRVGIHDDFFDLGGHSLLAVQLLSRVRQVFDAPVSLEVVYGGPFTIAELAKVIELKEIERAGGGEYASILAELEGLSDDEVRALLAAEPDEGLRGEAS